jgi:hypothetical protein
MRCFFIVHLLEKRSDPMLEKVPRLAKASFSLSGDTSKLGVRPTSVLAKDTQGHENAQAAGSALAIERLPAHYLAG